MASSGSQVGHTAATAGPRGCAVVLFFGGGRFGRTLRDLVRGAGVAGILPRTLGGGRWREGQAASAELRSRGAHMCPPARRPWRSPTLTSEGSPRRPECRSSTSGSPRPWQTTWRGSTWRTSECCQWPVHLYRVQARHVKPRPHATGRELCDGHVDDSLAKAPGRPTALPRRSVVGPRVALRRLDLLPAPAALRLTGSATEVSWPGPLGDRLACHSVTDRS